MLKDDYGMIADLRQMSKHLGDDETELCDLTASALSKLERMSDSEFAALELVPDFGAEE